MAKRKVKKRVKMSKFERLIYTFALVLASQCTFNNCFF